MISTRKTIVAVLLFAVAAFPWKAFGYCFEEAGAHYGISPEILRAIAGVESKINHSSLNYNRNGTYDLGVMQINSIWRPVLGEDLWSLAYWDPCWNTYCGAYILATCIHKHGYTWKAIGCYHSGNPKHANPYIRKVFKQMEHDRKKNPSNRRIQ